MTSAATSSTALRQPAIGVAPRHAWAGPALVATARGTMAHRRDCVVVAGKADLRPVGPGDGLAPCKLCDPYGPDDA